MSTIDDDQLTLLDRELSEARMKVILEELRRSEQEEAKLNLF